MSGHAEGDATGLLESLLIKTSRTFALSIPVLPEPTRREVTLAYLLFRVADTLEDATGWGAERKLAELERFGALLAGGSAVGAPPLAASWAAEPPVRHEGYRELLAELPKVVDAFEALASPAREQIRTHTLRTIELMAAFVRRTDAKQTLELDDLQDLRDYCYAVAGIVGEMLTELFLLESPRLEPAAPFLRKRAAAFGEALQLVNILKDSAGDAVEGRRYLPRHVERNEVFTLARRDLDEAERYVLRLQEASAERGVVAFTALPVLLARATLDRVEQAGPGAKLQRAEVMQIVARLDEALARDEPAVARSTNGLRSRAVERQDS